ncbi:MAG: hypothetical protein RR347_09315 [Anaerovoracaceae bacterium]
MRKIIFSIAPLIWALASVASISSLAFIESFSLITKIFFVALAFFALFILFMQAHIQNQVNCRECHCDAEIKAAMKDIIKSQGKVCIMSRDLSWIDENIEKCILSKKNSILIFAEKATGNAKNLEEKGVDVKYYGKLGFEPKTRFTVIRYNKLNPQVAIANTQDTIRKKNKFTHIIYQTVKDGPEQDQWINSMAIDMISLCTLACERIKNGENI